MNQIKNKLNNNCLLFPSLILILLFSSCQKRCIITTENEYFSMKGCLDSEGGYYQLMKFSYESDYTDVTERFGEPVYQPKSAKDVEDWCEAVDEEKEAVGTVESGLCE